MNPIIFETIGVIAGLCVALPSIPQIRRTYKTKNVKGLSLQMFFVWLTGGVGFTIYGRYLSSLQIMIFNAISATCSLIMILLILKYRKN